MKTEKRGREIKKETVSSLRRKGALSLLEMIEDGRSMVGLPGHHNLSFAIVLQWQLPCLWVLLDFDSSRVSPLGCGRDLLH